MKRKEIKEYHQKSKEELEQQAKKIAEELAECGESGELCVIGDIWNDGGGDPVFLSDVIQELERRESII